MSYTEHTFHLHAVLCRACDIITAQQLQVGHTAVLGSLIKKCCLQFWIQVPVFWRNLMSCIISIKNGGSMVVPQDTGNTQLRDKHEHLKSDAGLCVVNFRTQDLMNESFHRYCKVLSEDQSLDWTFLERQDQSSTQVIDMQLKCLVREVSYICLKPFRAVSWLWQSVAGLSLAETTSVSGQPMLNLWWMK